MDEKFLELSRGIRRMPFLLEDRKIVTHTFCGKRQNVNRPFETLGKHAEVTFRKPKPPSAARIEEFMSEILATYIGNF
jgi:hypothetical protein